MSRQSLVRSVRLLIAAYERRQFEEPPSLPAWSGAAELVSAADRMDAAAEKTLAAAMQASNRAFAPLVDPLLVDLDEHRWLSSDREESYSDWLAWILRQLRSPNAVFGFLGLEPPPSLHRGKPDVLVDRERVTEYGRLDLLIEFGSEAVIVVEVKLSACDDHIGPQLQRYENWLRAQDHRHKFAVVVGLQSTEPHIGNFQFLPWTAISRRLRRLGLDWKGRRNLIPAALALAFAGAIEQNLLTAVQDRTNL